MVDWTATLTIRGTVYVSAALSSLHPHRRFTYLLTYLLVCSSASRGRARACGTLFLPKRNHSLPPPTLWYACDHAPPTSALLAQA